MSDRPLYAVTVIANGQNIQVYQQNSTGNWVDYNDCTTVYKREELKGLPPEN